MAFTEAVVFFNRQLGADFAHRSKQAGQICSKMRYISAQWRRILTEDIWRKHASHANRLALMLAEKLSALSGVEILHPVEANAVFTRMPDHVKDQLKSRGWKFYSFIGGGSRLMCSWHTTEEDVKALVSDARAAT